MRMRRRFSYRRGGEEEEEDDLEEAEAVLEEQEEVDDDEDDTGRDTQSSSSQRWAENERTGSLATLARMASCMLTCLRTDRRIIHIKQTDDYWIAMLLDPRYQSNMGECFPPEEREEKLRYYQEALCTKLATAFCEQMPAASVSKREATLRPPQTHPPPGANSRSRNSSSSSSSQFSLLNMMEHFFQVPRQALSIQQAQSTRLDSQVQAYLDSGLSTAHGLFPDPMDFWAGRLQQWPELTHYALSLFSCPASSVISERVFSAAGGVVTPKRTKLSSASVQNITFVKMNQAWIRPDFHTPPPEADE